MSRVVLGWALLLGASACSSDRGMLAVGIDPEPEQAGQFLLFLEKPTGRILPFDTRAGRLVSDDSRVSELRQGFGEIVAVSSVPTTHRAGPPLALLTRVNGERTALRVLAPNLSRTDSIELGDYGQLRVSGDLALLLPSRREAAATPGGLHDQSVGLVDLSFATRADELDGSVALPAFKIPYDTASELDFGSLAVGVPGPGSRSVALASATEVFVARADYLGSKGATSSTEFQAGSSFKVDLSGRRDGALRPPKLQFDALASRLFFWTAGSSELFWLNLTADDASLDAARLSRLELESPPSDFAVASTGGGELLVSVAHRPGEPTRVSVVDLLTSEVSEFLSAVVADSVLVLKSGGELPDTLVFFERATHEEAATSLGISNADTLLQSRRLDDPSQSITQVTLGQPYRDLQRIDEAMLWLGNSDGSASLYNLADSTLSPLPGWSERARYLASGSNIGRRLFSEERGEHGYVIRPFTKQSGFANEPLRVPSRTLRVFELGDSAYAFIHPGTLGSLTYYESRNARPASYTAVGFLAPELAR